MATPRPCISAQQCRRRPDRHMARFVLISCATMFRAAVSFLLVLMVVAPASAQCANVSLPGGSGCGPVTPFGIPIVSCSGLPAVGNASFGFNTAAVCFSGLPAVGFLVAGQCLPAPLALSGFGPGGFCGPSQAFCALWVNPEVTLGGTPSGSGFSFPVPIPNSPLLVGAQLCLQGVTICTGVPCVSLSNAVSVTIF